MKINLFIKQQEKFQYSSGVSNPLDNCIFLFRKRKESTERFELNEAMPVLVKGIEER